MIEKQRGGTAASPAAPPVTATPAKIRSPAAQRALAEAEARAARKNDVAHPPEIGGRNGPEPTRYGDWERKGIVSDF